MAIPTFKEWLEWRGQRGEQRTGKDIRKTGGRPKGSWVSGNPRYHGGTDTGIARPTKKRSFWKHQDTKELKYEKEKEKEKDE